MSVLNTKVTQSKRKWFGAGAVSIAVSVLSLGLILPAAAGPLQDKIADLQTKNADLQAKISQLGLDQGNLISRYGLTNARSSALFVLGVNTAAKGQNVQMPIVFIPSLTPVAGVQQDIILPSSFTFVSITAGPAATAAGKNVTVNTANGITRLIIFGLNQNTIGAGVLATLTVKSTTTIPLGIYPFVTTNPVATDGNGLPVPMSTTSGWVKIQ